MSRTPDEILTVLDEAQARLGEEFDLRSLLWEVLYDALDSVSLAANSRLPEPYSTDLAAEVGDYLANHYGDD